MRGLPGVGLLEPAHVSLGYPWLAAEAALAAVDRVHRAAAAVPAFEALLTGPHRFAPDPRGRVLVHARLRDEQPVRALAAAVGADLRDVHLSVARVLPAGDVAAVEAAVAPLLPLAVRVETLELTVRRAGAWSRALLAPLGANYRPARSGLSEVHALGELRQVGGEGVVRPDRQHLDGHRPTEAPHDR